MRMGRLIVCIPEPPLNNIFSIISMVGRLYANFSFVSADMSVYNFLRTDGFSRFHRNDIRVERKSNFILINVVKGFVPEVLCLCWDRLK